MSYTIILFLIRGKIMNEKNTTNNKNDTTQTIHNTSEFDFDLNKTDERINGDFIQMPTNLNSTEIKDWLKETAEKLKS